MARHLLSDKAIQQALKAAAVAGKPKTLNDGAGLQIICRPDRVGWWRLRYWVDGRENRLSLGVYPDVSLAQARERHSHARAEVAAGHDPSEQRKAAKVQRTAQAEAERAGLPGPGCFEFVARQWLREHHAVKVSAGHAERTRIRFEQDCFRYIGHRPIAEIEPPELLEVLRRVTARGAIETAHRLKDACGQVFRYGVATGACARNPAADLRDALPPVPGRHHAAIVEPQPAAELLRAMQDYRGHPITRAALTLSALLFLRPGELRQLEWAWVNYDDSLITIPAALMKRTKSGKAAGPAHIVPLAPQAVRVLREIHAISGGARYVFPSLLSRDRPMSENTVNTALRRMGFDRDIATAHGFRAMARTMAAERLGVAPEVIEAQLAHSVGDALGRAYNRTQFLEQRRELMFRWADYLDRLREGGAVIALVA